MQRFTVFDLLTIRRELLLCAVVCAGLVACVDTVAPPNPQSVTRVPPQPPAPPSSPNGSILGFILDEQSGGCIIGARVVMVDGPQAGAVFVQAVCSVWDYDEDNGYAFYDLPYAQYTLRATAEGYEPTEIRATPSYPFFFPTMIMLKRTK